MFPYNVRKRWKIDRIRDKVKISVCYRFNSESSSEFLEQEGELCKTEFINPTTEGINGNTSEWNISNVLTMMTTESCAESSIRAVLLMKSNGEIFIEMLAKKPPNIISPYDKISNMYIKYIITDITNNIYESTTETIQFDSRKPKVECSLLYSTSKNGSCYKGDSLINCDCDDNSFNYIQVTIITTMQKLVIL